MSTSSTFRITSHGEVFDFRAEGWSPEFRDYLQAQGLKIILDRSSASETKKGGATEADRKAACREVAKRLMAGEIPARGGSRVRLSPEDVALRAACNAVSKAEGGETLGQQVERIGKAAAREQGKAWEPEMAAKVVEWLKTTKVYKTALAAREASPPKTDGLVF